MIKYCRCI